MGNLSFEVTRDELIQAFSEAGKVVDAKVPTDRETGRPRGFAFVQFESDDAAQRCIAQLNGRQLKGRPLRVNEAEDRPPRAPGAGPAPRPSFGGPRPGGGFGGPPPADFGGGDEFGRERRGRNWGKNKSSGGSGGGPGRKGAPRRSAGERRPRPTYDDDFDYEE